MEIVTILDIWTDADQVASFVLIAVIFCFVVHVSHFSATATYVICHKVISFADTQLQLIAFAQIGPHFSFHECT